MKYEIKKKNLDWLNNGPWYNTTICSKLHGTAFEDFIINYGTDRYNLMCYITATGRQQPKYVDNASSDCGR